MEREKGNKQRTIYLEKKATQALVSASLLFQKDKYQTIANNLPGEGVLICETNKKERIIRILESVAAFFRQNGHVVRTLPYSLLIQASENRPLSLTEEHDYKCF